jgi:hypothetical protein
MLDRTPLDGRYSAARSGSSAGVAADAIAVARGRSLRHALLPR